MKKILYVFLVLSFLSSCSDSLLDLKPLDAISEDDVFSDEKLLTDYVNANYNDIRDPFSQRLWNDSYSDNAKNRHDYRGTLIFCEGSMTADNGEVVTGSLWSNSYSNIRKINIFFSKIDQSSVSKEVKTKLAAEMHFIRAYVYADMIWSYGGVPIIKDIYDIKSDYSKITRNSYDDVVSYIISELDKAYADLPSVQTEIGRATKAAALALKSRVLLYAASPLNNPTNDKAKWQAAADASKAVIDLGYTLHPNYAEVFTTTTSEAIWVRQFTKAKGHINNLLQNPNGYGGWVGDAPLQNLVDEYETTDGKRIFLDDGTVNPASNYDPQNPYVNREPRFYATINYNGKKWKDRTIQAYSGGLDSKDGTGGWNATETGYCLCKWVIENEPVSESIPSTSSYIFFRTAEFYLNYAEAQIELGQESEARKYINLIRARVNLPAINASGDELKKLYRHERRIELAFEDHRFYDILRWKIADQLLTGNALGVRISKLTDGTIKYEYDRVAQVRVFRSQYYRMPIPRSEIDKTSGSLVQNPGYN